MNECIDVITDKCTKALVLEDFLVVFRTLLHTSTIVTDDPGYSQLRSDFSSVRGNVILMVDCLKKGLLGHF